MSTGMARYRRRPRRPSFDWVNLKVILGALVTASLLVICSLSLLWMTRPGPSSAGSATAIFNVISAPVELSVPVTATLTGEPGAATPLPPPAGEIGIGAYVQVSGTAGAGLRLRSEAGLNSDVLLLAAEAEVFRVQEGPKDVDGYTWWYLVGPFDETRVGWAVSNYLVVVQSP